MGLQISNRAELKRFRKLLTMLDNKTVIYPLRIYRGKTDTAAFMESRPEREFLVKTQKGKARSQMSDRRGAREGWIKREETYPPPTAGL